MTEPRAWTEDEVRIEFLKRCWHLIDYWDTVQSDYNQRSRMAGAVFSMLVMLDGGQMGICGFKVIPSPHPDDKEYCKSEGENWFPDDCDIAGYLHELFHKLDPKLEKK